MQNTVKIEVTTWLLYTLAPDIFFLFFVKSFKVGKKTIENAW